MRVHCLQHEPFEGLGSMESWFRDKGARVTTVHLYQDPRLPEVSGFDWLVVMGGGMSVNDEASLPWLVPEKGLVREAVAAGKVVLGVCLGAQMIASALGARVYRNRFKEIGWWPVRRHPDAEGHPLAAVFPGRFEAFHWHGETFDLPPGSVPLALSEACANQAFAVGNAVLGLQFHLETTFESAEALMAACPGDLAPGPFVQQPADILERADRFDALNPMMRMVLETLAAAPRR